MAAVAEVRGAAPPPYLLLIVDGVVGLIVWPGGGLVLSIIHSDTDCAIADLSAAQARTLAAALTRMAGEPAS